MSYKADNISITFEGQNIPVYDFEINMDISPRITYTYHPDPIREYTGTMKITEINRRFFTITPFEKIRYLLRLFRYKVISFFRKDLK